MTEKEEQFWSDAALEAAKKAKAEEVAGAPPPDLDKLLSLTVSLFGHGKTSIEEVVRGVRPEATKIFTKAITGTAQERFDARLGLFEKRYQKKTPAEAKKGLELLWNYTDRNKVAPKNIISSPNDLQHSAVAMELTAHLASLNYKKEIAANPRFWWSEVERAYQSIDFKHMSPKEEVELRVVFERSFDHMRDLAKQDPDSMIQFPGDNKTLWRGLGDYHFSTNVPYTPGEPANIRTQKQELLERVRQLQEDLLHPHTSDTEKRLLNTFVEDLNKGLAHQWVDLTDEVENIQYRAVQEAQELSSRPEGEGERGRVDTAESRAEILEKFDALAESKARGTAPLAAPTAGMFSSSEDKMKAFFGESKWLNVRVQMADLAEMFRNKSDFEAFNFDDQGKLQSARGALDNIMRTYGKEMSPDQRAVIESYKVQVESEFNSLLKREQAPSRFYLPEDIQHGLEVDPIGTANRIVNEAIQAYIEEPESPLAKFYFEQLELLEYYLFSPQHNERIVNFNVVMLKSKEEMNLALREGRMLEGRRASAKEIADNQEKIKKLGEKKAQLKEGQLEQLKTEKSKLEREFNIRLKDAQFVQVWKHASEANDETFQRFLNGRMTEDSFWGIDGLYGGLVKKFRMELRRQYEKQLFNARGDRNAHVDKLWDEAWRLTKDKMMNNKQNIEIFKDYLSGEYFKDTPKEGPESILIGERGPIKDPEAKKEYQNACKVITEFASMRMIMSGEKYVLDVRFLPIKDGVNLGQPGVTTQFKEKQKIAKLIHTYGAWQKTWGGIMLGDPTERLQMRERSDFVRTAIPEVTEWADERAKDYWRDIQGFRSLAPEDQRRVYGEVKSLFEFSVDKKDWLPDWDWDGFVADKEEPGKKAPTKEEKIADWFKYNMNFNKLRDECRFDSGMQISDMHGLFPYLGVSESGARRSAQRDALFLMLGGKSTEDPEFNKKVNEIATQNFLTFTQLEAGLNYFRGKSNADTDQNRAKFLKKMSDITKYRPQANLLVLREGESKSLKQWVKDRQPDIHDGLMKCANYKDDPVQKVDGRELFGGYYEYLDTIHEELFSQLALREQINYAEGLDELKKKPEQWNTAKKYFMGKHNQNEAEAGKEMVHYFGEMKKVVDYLGVPTGEGKDVKSVKDMKFPTNAAVMELTKIQYGPLLMKMRWDDYPYELLQYPERAMQILTKQEWHPLHGKTLDVIRKDQKLATQYLMKASDQNEPQRAHDEQSGLWRRMWRDLGGDATLFGIIGEAWGLDPQASAKALKQIHHTLVGIQGDEVAQINHLMSLTQKLAIQEVYKKYGSLLVGLPNSAPIKKLLPGRKAFAPDAIAHEFEAGLELGSGKSRYQAPGASGFEFAAKQKLRISYWNRIFGGMSKREEWMERMNDEHPWTKRFINAKTIEDLPEWLDLHAPLGVWRSKVLPVTLAGLILLLVFTAQQATGGEEKKSRH